jgi:hypothetical protein
MPNGASHFDKVIYYLLRQTENDLAAIFSNEVVQAVARRRHSAHKCFALDQNGLRTLSRRGGSRSYASNTTTHNQDITS